MTGARFSELARLLVKDFDPANGSVFVAKSKTAKARHIALPPGGVTLFHRLASGRDPGAPLLERAGAHWKPSTYARGLKSAVAKADLEHITFHELRHTYASTMVRAGAPLMVVAEALGQVGTRMVEKHYAHLSPSFVRDTIRKTAPNLDYRLTPLWIRSSSYELFPASQNAGCLTFGTICRHQMNGDERMTLKDGAAAMSVAEFAQWVGIGRTTAWGLIKSGSLRAVKIGSPHLNSS